MKRRHTKRDLVRLFKERGLRAKRLLGQNFLVDHNVLQLICRAGEVSEKDAVLEIGAGTGLLTEHLARTGADVVAVEIDRDLFDIASEYTGDATNVLLLHSDIHGTRRRIHPDVEAEIRARMRRGRTLKVISNLPYCISSDLLVSLLEMRHPVERMVLTVQNEFADRLVARPRSRDYSALTVLLRAQATVTRLRALAPSVFWPVPKVGSAIVLITPDAERRAAVGDYRRLKSVVSVLFGQRRKTVARVLRSIPRARLTSQRADALLEADIHPDTRADALSVSQIIALSNALGGD